MRASRISLLAAALAFGVVAACGGGNTTTSSSSGSGGGQGGQGGHGGHDPTPPESCVKPGDKGNEKGVGEYCSPGGQQCFQFAEAGLCLADVGQDQWFCTRLGCTTDADCGTDATCYMDAQNACVPNRCLDGTGGGPADAGAD